MVESGHTPKFWLEKPTLNTENIWLRDAYNTLSRSRQLSAHSEYFIPLTEYKAYCELNGIYNLDEVTYLVEVLTRVDSVLLSERIQKMNEEMKRKA